MKLKKENWSRSNTFSNDLVLLDGISGTGKTMIMRILDSYPKIMPPRFNYHLEHLLIAIFEKKVSIDAGIELMQLNLDQNIYDSAISREFNFRPKDLSSVFKSKKKIEYIRRLFLSDGQMAENRIISNNEKILLVVHQLLDASLTLDLLPKKKIIRILCVRHPYYLFNHWVSCVDMFGKTPRDFSVTTGDRFEVPWFLEKNPKIYLDESSANKSAHLIAELNFRQIKFIKDNPKVLVINFEEFVLNPISFINKMSYVIGESPRRIKPILRREKIPRNHINGSRNEQIYKRYNSDLLKTTDGHEVDYIRLRNYIKKSVTSKNFAKLQASAVAYEAIFGKWF